MTKITSFLLAAWLFSSTLWAADNTLTVYTYDSLTADWGAGPKLKEAFEADCGCTLTLVGLPDGGAILSRLQIEGENTKADAVLGLDQHLVDAAETMNLFIPHGVNQPIGRLPVKWDHPLFLPFDFGWLTFVYNTETVRQPPTSLKTWVESNAASPTLIFQNPQISTPGLGFMLWIKQLYGADVDRVWQKIARKTVTVSGSWSESYTLFLKGEADMVLSYTTSPAYHRIVEQDNRFAGAVFTEGHMIQIELAGLLKTSANQELARAFLTFLVSPEAQQMLPTAQWMFPVADVELPAGFADAAVPPKTIVFEGKLDNQSKRRLIREWQTGMRK